MKITLDCYDKITLQYIIYAARIKILSSNRVGNILFNTANTLVGVVIR